ncbi:hypothetical protein N7493_000974 [Penicillium malachiteum]|uniref:Uncharacterized protein n=1 Tax=Penicillium malachiteum TaxID=1324776 RepID=A0AAD6N1H6_9EURO|nr:hypothetical protein N7493_000974 [Penicillium malachiteum]
MSLGHGTSEALYLDFGADAKYEGRFEALSVQIWRSGVRHVQLSIGFTDAEAPERDDGKIRVRTDLRGNSMDYEALLSHPRATRYVAEFLLQTGILGQLRPCEVEPEPILEDDETTGQN